jgi:prepilin-type N-terminal cleavage/methylation domain-containing protein
MKRNAGFTLIEMMITIGIIAIISAVAVPNMIAWRNNMQMNSAARLMKSSIESSRMAAIRTNMPSQVNFIDGGTSFNMLRWDPAANAFGVPETIQLPAGVVLEDSNFVNDQLRFTSRGMPANAIGGTLQLEDDSHSLCRLIVVANVGSSRIANCP